jgi:hypothetical protein
MRYAMAISVTLAAAFAGPRAHGAYTIIDLTPTASNATAGGIAGGQQVGTVLGAQVHAMLFRGTAASAVDLHPAGFTFSAGTGTNGTIQAGQGRTSGGQLHALLWQGTAASVVDLNPFNTDESHVNDVTGNEQVGFFHIAETYHAVLWHGTSASAVDLNRADYTSSFANGTSGTQQVGTAYPQAEAGLPHAVLWSGTASSAIDLRPSGYNESVGNDVAGNQQVGYAVPNGSVDNNAHAMLWNGTAASAVDLHPAGFSFSEALATDGVHQLGYAGSGESFRAIIWNGTADSAVRLPLLSPYQSSWAEGIDADGNILGTVFNDTAHRHVVIWVPTVPEPGVASASLLVTVTLLGRKRSTRP